VAELADALDLGSSGAIRAGSTPVVPTNAAVLPLQTVTERGSFSSGVAGAPKNTLRAEVVFLLQASRPGFWLTAIWFYLLPVAQRPVWSSPEFWLGIFFISFPFGLLIYGWNDVVDRENDRRNPRKGSFLFGARGTDAQLRRLPWVIALVHAPFAVWFATTVGAHMLVWYAALIGATALYNAPRFGFKNYPFVDVLNQGAYWLVFYFSSAINSVPSLPWQTMLFGVLFAMHSHLLGEVMDLVPDRLAGRRTTALLLGAVRTKLLIAAFLAVEAALVNHAFGDWLITVVLASGAAWFVMDAAWLGRRDYPVWLARGFLLGWNLVAIASAWYVWSTGALTHVR
jgi:4-hydroxybenzoate polyprenyltransferase